MAYNYFKFENGVEITETAIKSQWRKIVLTVHPDKGGCKTDFQKAFDEYEQVLKSAGNRFKSENPDSFDSMDEFLASIDPDTLAAFHAASNIAGINEIEVCGTWIWIKIDKSQETERAALKEIEINGNKFRFAKKKLSWYFGKSTGKKRGNWSMDKIRSNHGSNVVKTDKKKKALA